MSRLTKIVIAPSVGLVLLAGSVGLSTVAQASSEPRVQGQVIASGLNNPRGISLGEGKTTTLYVTEAGLGSGNTVDGVQEGVGATGSITAIARPNSSRPSASRIVTGLASAAAIEGGSLEALGPDGISAWGHGSNSGYVTIIGAAGEPGLGELLKATGTNAPVTISDVGAAGLAWSAQYVGEPWASTQFPDSDPYGVLVAKGHTYVVDAATNTLDEVLASGVVNVLAHFPHTEYSDSVPTCVAQGPDGALYVGTLALADFFIAGPGSAKVYRVDPKATVPNDITTILSVPSVWATGFSTITGCTFDKRGNFYAVEMFTGDVVKVPFAHPASGRSLIGSGQLNLPNGVAVDDEGTVYVSNMSDSTVAGTGSVIRFRSRGNR